MGVVFERKASGTSSSTTAKRSRSRLRDPSRGAPLAVRGRSQMVQLPRASLVSLRASLARCKGAAVHLKNMNEAAAEAFQREIDTFDIMTEGVVDLRD